MRLSFIYSLTLSSSVLAIENAAVYKMNSYWYYGNEDFYTPTISQKDSILNLADDIGFAECYSIDDTQDLSVIGLGKSNTLRKDEEKELVLIINAVDNPSTFFESSESPIYNIELRDDREAYQFKQFLQEIPEKLIKLNKKDFNLNKLSDEITLLSKKGSKSDVLQELWTRYFGDDENNKAEMIWNESKGSFTQSNRLKLSERSVNSINDKSFIKELAQLDFFLNDQLENNIKDDKVLIKLDSLISVFKKTGLNSQTYETCKNLISNLILNKLEDTGIKCTIIVLPVDQELMTLKFYEHENIGKSELRKRDHENSILASKNSIGCFNSQEKCLDSSDSCSDHGACAKVGQCWKCVCSPTKDDNDRTSFWTGNACEKLDYSSQFNLLFWTSLILIFSMISGIKLLYKCGEEELPGVLVAATMQTKKAT